MSFAFIAYVIAQEAGKFLRERIALRFISRNAKNKALESFDLGVMEVAPAAFASGTPLLVS